jgi:hypothetical protein
MPLCELRSRAYFLRGGANHINSVARALELDTFIGAPLPRSSIAKVDKRMKTEYWFIHLNTALQIYKGPRI